MADRDDEPKEEPRGEDPASEGPAKEKRPDIVRATILPAAGPGPEAEEPEEEQEYPEEIAVLPLRHATLFPGTVLPLTIGRPKSVRLVEQALASDRHLGLVAQRDGEQEDPKPEGLHRVGVLGQVLRLIKLGDGSQNIIVQGLVRFRIEEILTSEPFFRARVTYLEDIQAPETENEALRVSLRELAIKVIELSPNIPAEATVIIRNLEETGPLADFLAANLGLPIEQKQEILEELDIAKRAQTVTRILTREIEVLELSNKIQSQVKESMDKTQREYFLREQLKAIREELGEKDDRTVEIEELEKRLKEADLPEEARKEAERELKRLARMPAGAAEYTVSRTYLDWLLDLPWRKVTEDRLDLPAARRILEEDHYDLEKVKKRILEYLAVRKLKPDAKGPILCLVGPPGVGKTSVGRSIARALGRQFARLSLGGVRDEAEIRGHRRTYIGSLPGRIIQSIRKAGTANPVFMLDELDKVGMDIIRGDPASALLEVLDPEQNNTFSDHYLEVPFDLSRVLFIATANILETVPPALKDRLEVLELPGYTEDEKVGIAAQYLIPRQLDQHGLDTGNLKIEESAVRGIIASYTREAGVRNLERDIAALCRGVARRVAEGETGRTVVTDSELHEYLGPIRVFSETAERLSSPGVATGLVWTPTGGDIIFIEVTAMMGKGSLILTGHLGTVMQESATAALSYLRSVAAELHLPEARFLQSDIHIHVPAGAIPKDGPSAGLTIFIALTSFFTRRPVRHDVAMTGEITLRGQILPIGGLKEKVLGAVRSGIRNVILPERNRKDLEEIPEPIRKQVTFHFIRRAEEALEIALLHPDAQPETEAEPTPPARVAAEQSDVHAPSPPAS